MNRIIKILVCLLLLGCSNNIEKEYYENGTLKSILNKNNKGQLNGIAKYFYENGNIKSEEKYVNGDLKYRKSFYPSGQIYWMAGYEQGKMNGEYKEYSQNGYLILEGKVIDEIFVQYNKYDSLNKIIMEYIRIDSTKIPKFNQSFIQLECEGLYTNKFCGIKLKIPSIPSSQLLPFIANGTVQLIDRTNGIWEAQAHSKSDSVVIGISVYIDDSTEYFVGYKKYGVIQ